MKRCPRCGTTKPVSEFHKGAGRSFGVRSWCKECCAAYSRERYAKKRDHILAVNKIWREENPAHHDKLRAEWKTNNYDKVVHYQHRRRAKKASAVPQRLRRHEDHPAHLCYYCGKHTRVNVRQGRSDKRTTDHITPFALGGEAKPYNEVPACNSCNIRKRNKPPWVWMAEQF